MEIFRSPSFIFIIDYQIIKFLVRLSTILYENEEYENKTDYTNT